MALCTYCDQEMTTAGGCTDVPHVIDHEKFPPIRYGSEPGYRRIKQRCHDCNVVPGRVHHHGCDVERCPACGRQSISCDCLWAGEEHLAEDWIDEMEERFELDGPDE
jgi:hypothetical protein